LTAVPQETRISKYETDSWPTRNMNLKIRNRQLAHKKHEFQNKKLTAGSQETRISK